MSVLWFKLVSFMCFQLKYELDEVIVENSKLHTELTQFQLETAETKRLELEKLQDAHERSDTNQGHLNIAYINLIMYDNSFMHVFLCVHPLVNRSVQVLKSRVRELESVESKLVHSETEAKELQRSLRTCKQDYYFVESEKEKLLKYNEIERQLRQLAEENSLLRKQRDNADLLKYKVQSLQEKCTMYEGLEVKVAELELENQHLRKQVEEGDGEKALSGSQPALQYRITELQQKEVILVNKQGELLTR